MRKKFQYIVLTENLKSDNIKFAIWSQIADCRRRSLLSYMTSQRKALYETLEQHRDEALTAEQIMSFIGDGVSRSAVYRNLASLEKQGAIKRTAAPGSNTVMYRYTGSDTCRNHLHLECSECGNTYHLNVPATAALINDVMQDASFQVDSSSTVLYGICEKCRKN